MRRVLLVVAAGLALCAALELMLYRQYREQQGAVDRALDARLLGLAATAAAWIGGGDPAARGGDWLVELARANDLEDAYVLDAGLKVVAGARTPPGSAFNLLRLDAARLERALAGQPSVGEAYSVDGDEILAAYAPAGDAVVALEAGAAFRELAGGLRRSWLIGAALAGGLALLFAGGLAAAGRALERAREAASRAARLADLGAMAALVAHEVRNPLGTLRGQVELIGERLPADAPPRERERIGEMLEEIDRLTAVTDELLTLGREGTLARESVDLARLAAGVIARVARAQPGARLESTIADGLAVIGDPAKLEQALFNLVLNAAQIGGEGVKVTLAAAQAPSAITLSVSDDGPGIAPGVGARLFDPFVTARPNGRGLGLAVARFVAERHGGRLELGPVPPGGRGAVFLLRLPWRAS